MRWWSKIWHMISKREDPAKMEVIASVDEGREVTQEPEKKETPGPLCLRVWEAEAPPTALPRTGKAPGSGATVAPAEHGIKRPSRKKTKKRAKKRSRRKGKKYVKYPSSLEMAVMRSALAEKLAEIINEAVPGSTSTKELLRGFRMAVRHDPSFKKEVHVAVAGKILIKED